MVINLIKYLGMAKKGFSVASGFIGLYRIYFIVGGFILAFLGTQQYRIKSRDVIIAEQLKEMLLCKEANKTSQDSIRRIKLLYRDLTKKLSNADNKNDIAIIEVKAKKKANNEKTKILKDQVVINTCAINADNIKLLKKANNQN